MKNPLAASSQVKRTLKEVGISLPKSAIKRRLHESKSKVFPQACPGLKQNSLYRFKKYGEGKEWLMIQRIPHHLWNRVKAVLWNGMHGYQWNWITSIYWWYDCWYKGWIPKWIRHYYLLRFSKCCKTDGTALLCTDGQLFKAKHESSPRVFHGKKGEYFSMVELVTWPRPN